MHSLSRFDFLRKFWLKFQQSGPQWGHIQKKNVRKLVQSTWNFWMCHLAAGNWKNPTFFRSLDLARCIQRHQNTQKSHKAFTKTQIVHNLNQKYDAILRSDANAIVFFARGAVHPPRSQKRYWISPPSWVLFITSVDLLPTSQLSKFSKLENDLFSRF